MNCRRRFVCAALPALLAACATSGGMGERLGTELWGTGNAVNFRWIAEHPWDNRFRAGAPLRLVANYAAEGRGMVTEVVATARPSSTRNVTFVLPEALLAVPTGPVCMFIEQSGEQIPIRSARAASGTDTRQFRYPPWEQTVSASSRSRSVADSLARARVSDTALDTSVNQWRMRLNTQGATSDADCPRLAEAAGRAAAGPPRATIPPEQQDATSRQVCVWKARNSAVEHTKRRHEDNRVLVLRLDLPKLIGAVRDDGTAAGATEDAAVRGMRAKLLADGQRFLADWRAHGERVRADYRAPVIIAPGDNTLPLGKASSSLLERWSFPEFAHGGALNASERLGLLFVVLAGYDDCVSGTQVQLKADHTAALLRAERDPIRRRQAEESVASECRAGFARMADLEQRRSVLRAEIVRLEAEQAALPKSTGRAMSQPTSLNETSCRT